MPRQRLKKIILILLVGLVFLFAVALILDFDGFRGNAFSLLGRLNFELGPGEGGGDSQISGFYSCILNANPSGGIGPFNSQLTATFTNLPAGVNQALIKCNQNDSGINVPIQSGSASRNCSYPQVQVKTFFFPNATGGTATCSGSVTDNPPSNDDNPPPPPPGGGGGNDTPSGQLSGMFEIKINDDASTTESRIVTLNLNGDNATKMTISNYFDFHDTAQINYRNEVQNWDLCSEADGQIKYEDCPEGIYSVYAQFYNDLGQSSEVVSGLIIYQKTVVNAPGEPGEPGESEKTEELKKSENKSGICSFSKPVVPFAKDLRLGIKGEDVKALQKFLNSCQSFQLAKNDFGAPGKETTYFGPLTKAALEKFQKTYGDKILKPLNLTKATGYFGSSTRKFINSFVSKSKG